LSASAELLVAVAKTDHNSSYIQRILMISVRNPLTGSAVVNKSWIFQRAEPEPKTAEFTVYCAQPIYIFTAFLHLYIFYYFFQRYFFLNSDQKW